MKYANTIKQQFVGMVRVAHTFHLSTLLHSAMGPHLESADASDWTVTPCYRVHSQYFRFITRFSSHGLIHVIEIISS